MPHGYFSLALTAHMPYVRHDQDDTFEERWLYQAIIWSYVPQLLALESMINDHVKFRITISWSPTLLTLLADPLIQARCESFIAQAIRLAQSEQRRTEKIHKEEYVLATMYEKRLRSIRSYLEQYHYNLTTVLKNLHKHPQVEWIVCAASHAYLPHIDTYELKQAQIYTGIETYQQMFQANPKGFMLPECAYTPEIDSILKQVNIQYFLLDSHGLQNANPQPKNNVYAPIRTTHGVHAFGRHRQASQRIWCSEYGYPGDYNYRDFYRDIGYDLDYQYILPYIHPTGVRTDTGFKYFQITGKTVHKKYYQPERALHQASEHATDYVSYLTQLTSKVKMSDKRQPLITVLFDAELFGHWWYEGPTFLEQLLRNLSENNEIESINPTEYLDKHPQNEQAQLSTCSWGLGGYSHVWVNKKNDWIYPLLHTAERKYVALLKKHDHPDKLTKRLLQQLGRELMLAQASDWAFIMTGKQMSQSAIHKTRFHLKRFYDLSKMMQSQMISEEQLTNYENQFPIFPTLNLNHFHAPSSRSIQNQTNTSLSVIILSWEFPPFTIGGISRAVYELSMQLVKQNVEVHIITCAFDRDASDERLNGIHIHRVKPLRPKPKSSSQSFFDWVFQMNTSLFQKVEFLLNHGLKVDIVHAHDWLVVFVAEALKKRYQFPLISTIHGLEYVRYQNDQASFGTIAHRGDQKLVTISDQIITCSQFMKNTVCELFPIACNKTSVIANGIEIPPPPTSSENDKVSDLRLKYAKPEEKILLFVGRLVYEKGVHILIEAIPTILKKQPHIKLIIAGEGSEKSFLESKIKHLNIQKNVIFTGFVADDQRNMFYRMSDICVIPSLSEPFGLVALEAMSYKLPLIVSSVGGLAEIVQHKENGLTMMNCHSKSLSDQVNWILENPAHVKKLTQNAYRTLNQYSWSKNSEQTKKLYESLQHKSPSQIGQIE
ncbi:DUF1957 domain-containing protein [Hazenella sp. IB182353]|uniref:1,4-alpha-glucan branching protein domain-containing protein n=1 Tax=Polycladospora coralii TaxID=2771432 RepID=UPI001746B99B|nr:1,4-alpha-glucan branching protein domain-containing protein [Polycladospora coralii]MBS7530125.1 DUF1957 domain-containing protein [Polycladospora coralii]